MEYNLKEKIEITTDFIEELISKSWQETGSLQQQIANIDTNTKLGAEVAKLLKNICNSYYVLIGCLETFTEDQNSTEGVTTSTMQNSVELEVSKEPIDQVDEQSENISLPVATIADFEPFEYFVEFDEPVGKPITDTDLYG